MPDKGHTVEEDGYVNQISATGRWYSLFASMAGVRGEGPDPRGLPDNLTKTVKLAVDAWDCDGHSHSWLTLKEFEELLKQHNVEPTDRVEMFYDWTEFAKADDYKNRPPDYSTIVAACKQQVEELEAEAILLDCEPSKLEHRLVFFFDN